MPPLDHDARVAVETAYRRGYCQGFYGALEALRQGKSLRELDNFLIDELTLAWRYQRHDGKFVQPPNS